MELMIGEKIKKYRREREMTQEALAQALQLSPQSVSKWECGDGYPDITLLPAIANFFEITVDELIGNDEISAKEDVQKNYFNVINDLSPDDKISLSLKYNKKYPRNWHVATSLMKIIVRYHKDKLSEYKKLFCDICERLLKDCTDSTMRRSAVKAMCMVCDEEDIMYWLNKDTTFWNEERIDVFEERYKFSGEEEKYWMLRTAGNFLRVSKAVGRLCESGKYKETPEDYLKWNTMYLNILNGVTQNSIPDGWICEYNMQYIRLSAAYFGLKDKDNGYMYLERALELNKRWNAIPDNEVIELGNPLLFGETKLVKGDWHIKLPNGEYLPNIGGIKYRIADLADIMTGTSGWNWFDIVRNEERWLSILASAKELAV